MSNRKVEGRLSLRALCGQGKLGTVLLSFSQRSCAHLAAALVASEQHTARRAGRVRQGEGRRLCVIAEHAFAVPKYDCKQLLHHVGAAPRQ